MSAWSVSQRTAGVSDKCALRKSADMSAARAQALAQGFADLCFTQPDRFNSKSCIFSAAHPPPNKTNCRSQPAIVRRRKWKEKNMK